MSTTIERLARLLAEHREAEDEVVGRGWVTACDCGWVSAADDLDGDIAFTFHLATVLADAGVGFVAEAQAEALREAADDWDVAGTVPRSILGNWLRDRAEQIGQQP